MNLIKRFVLSDLRDLEFELPKGTILDIFKTASVSGILQLISIGNGGISMEDASSILQEYLEDPNNSYIGAFKELRNAIFPQTSEEDQESLQIQYESLTDILNTYCMQLGAAGISMGDFWDLDTYRLFKVMHSINEKLALETNQKLQVAHAQAALIGAAFAGKLPKEAPSIKIDMTDPNAIIKLEDGKEVYYKDYKELMKVKSFFSQTEKKGGDN